MTVVSRVGWGVCWAGFGATDVAAPRGEDYRAMAEAKPMVTMVTMVAAVAAAVVAAAVAAVVAAVVARS